MSKKFVNISHELQNQYWHREYPDDLEHGEIVPFNAQRDYMSNYWWIQNDHNQGESRWRSIRQRQAMKRYIESADFKQDYERITAKIFMTDQSMFRP